MSKRGEGIDALVDTILLMAKGEPIAGRQTTHRAIKFLIESELTDAKVERGEIEGRIELLKKISRDNWQKSIPEEYILNLLRAELDSLGEETK